MQQQMIPLFLFKYYAQNYYFALLLQDFYLKPCDAFTHCVVFDHYLLSSFQGL